MTLERVIKYHIKKRVLAGNPLHRKQHACEPGKSIKRTLHKLVGKIKDTLDCKEKMLSAFIDFESVIGSTS